MKYGIGLQTCNVIGTRKSEFVTKIQLIYNSKCQMSKTEIFVCKLFNFEVTIILIEFDKRMLGIFQIITHGFLKIVERIISYLLYKISKQKLFKSSGF